MRKRILISAAIFMSVAVATVLGYWFLRPHPRIDQESLDKIQLGMTERDVIDIIGAPPGNYGVGEGEVDVFFGPRFRFLPPDSTTKVWLGQERAIEIVLNANGKVSEKHLPDVWREYDSHLDKLLQAVHLKEPKRRRIFNVW